MHNSLWKKVALGTAVAFGSCAVQAAPANAISIGFRDSAFEDIDSDDNLDWIVEPGSTEKLDVVLKDGATPDGFSGAIDRLDYEVSTNVPPTELEINTDASTFDSNALFPTVSQDLDTSNPNIGQTLQSNHSGGNVTLPPSGGAKVIDTIAFNVREDLENDGFNDVSFTLTELVDTEGNNNIDEDIEQNLNKVDLESDAQVPYEMETGFGLAAAAALFGYRKFRKLKAKRQNDAVAE